MTVAVGNATFLVALKPPGISWEGGLVGLWNPLPSYCWEGWRPLGYGGKTIKLMQLWFEVLFWRHGALQLAFSLRSGVGGSCRCLPFAFQLEVGGSV